MIPASWHPEALLQPTGYDPRPFIPTAKDRAAGDSLIARLRATPARCCPVPPVLRAPRRQAHLPAPHGRHGHWRAGMGAPRGLAEALDAQRFALIVMDDKIDGNWQMWPRLLEPTTASPSTSPARTSSRGLGDGARAICSVPNVIDNRAAVSPHAPPPSSPPLVALARARRDRRRAHRPRPRRHRRRLGSRRRRGARRVPAGRPHRLRAAPGPTRSAALHLGDLVSVEMAGRSDADRYARIWEVSIRGAHAPDVAGARLAHESRHGRVRVALLRAAPACRSSTTSPRSAADARVHARRGALLRRPRRAAGSAAALRVERRTMEIDYRPRRGLVVPADARATTLG